MLHAYPHVALLQVAVPFAGAVHVMFIGGYAHAPLLQLPGPNACSVVCDTHVSSGGESHETGTDQCKHESVWLVWQVRTASPSQSVWPTLVQSFEQLAAHAPLEQNGLADGHAVGVDQS